MSQIKFILLLGLFHSAFHPVVAGEVRENEGESPEQPSVRLLSDPSTTEKGLVVQIHEVELRGDKPAKVVYWIINYLEEEVFIEVREGEELAVEYRRPNGELRLSNGGGFPGFPDNLALLKRLHASNYQRGSRLTCGCAIARVEATAGISENELTTGETRFNVRVRGFYRANGNEFSESIDVPLTSEKRAKTE